MDPSNTSEMVHFNYHLNPQYSNAYTSPYFNSPLTRRLSSKSISWKLLTALITISSLSSLMILGPSRASSSEKGPLILWVATHQPLAPHPAGRLLHLLCMGLGGSLELELCCWWHNGFSGMGLFLGKVKVTSKGLVLIWVTQAAFDFAV